MQALAVGDAALSGCVSAAVDGVFAFAHGNANWLGDAADDDCGGLDYGLGGRVGGCLKTESVGLGVARGGFGDGFKMTLDAADSQRGYGAGAVFGAAGVAELDAGASADAAVCRAVGGAAVDAVLAVADAQARWGAQAGDLDSFRFD